MNPFSTFNYRRVQRAHVTAKAAGIANTPSLERWVLQYMHREAQLDYLARKVCLHLLRHGQLACVQFDSIWVDGTPQAYFTRSDGTGLNCELGDLLVVLDRYLLDPKGALSKLDRRALIVQAKVGIRALRMPWDNHSTRKERDLLEKANLSAGITLKTGTSGGDTIGTYALPGGIGLRDFATYMLYPKRGDWPDGHPDAFVCGWPYARTSRHVTMAMDYVEAIQTLSTVPVYGRALAHASTCAWTEMVEDLLARYRPITMSGYGGLPRVRSSRLHCVGPVSAGLGGRRMSRALFGLAASVAGGTPAALMMGKLGNGWTRPDGDGPSLPEFRQAVNDEGGPAMPVLQGTIVLKPEEEAEARA